MNYAGTILPEFDRETANTRKVLERVPEEGHGKYHGPGDGRPGHRSQSDLGDGYSQELTVLALVLGNRRRTISLNRQRARELGGWLAVRVILAGVNSLREPLRVSAVQVAARRVFCRF